VGERRAVPDARDLERRWAAVRGRMEAASEVLARRGSIASRLTGGGLRVYSVRFQEPGEKRQRAIYLGRDGELVRRARVLIGVYREREQQVREVEEVARFATVSSSFVRRLVSSRLRRPTRIGAS
jgi:hypothetical protein